MMGSEGRFDIPLFITRLRPAGYRGLYGVEILYDCLREWPIQDAARWSFDVSHAQFAKPSSQVEYR